MPLSVPIIQRPRGDPIQNPQLHDHWSPPAGLPDPMPIAPTRTFTIEDQPGLLVGIRSAAAGERRHRAMICVALRHRQEGLRAATSAYRGGPDKCSRWSRPPLMTRSRPQRERSHQQVAVSRNPIPFRPAALQASFKLWSHMTTGCKSAFGRYATSRRRRP
jgi:hypothetical protein